MLRTALKPKWLGLLAIVLLAATGMARLGEWQWQRAHQRGAATERAQQERAPVQLRSLLAPRQTFPASAAQRPVVVTGSWDPAGQLLVSGRLNGSATGYWVLTPLRLPDGSGVAVVRGWASSPGDPAAAVSALPAGQVRVTGLLLPAEPPADASPGRSSALPSGQLDRVDVTRLVQLWPYPLYTGFVVLTGQDPGTSGPALQPVSVTQSSGGLDLQNLSYALQWFLFAGLGFVGWWRLVRDDHLGRLPGPRGVPGPEGVSGTVPGAEGASGAVPGAEGMAGAVPGPADATGSGGDRGPASAPGIEVGEDGRDPVPPAPGAHP